MKLESSWACHETILKRGNLRRWGLLWLPSDNLRRPFRAVCLLLIPPPFRRRGSTNYC